MPQRPTWPTCDIFGLFGENSIAGLSRLTSVRPRLNDIVSEYTRLQNQVSQQCERRECNVSERHLSSHEALLYGTGSARQPQLRSGRAEDSRYLHIDRS